MKRRTNVINNVILYVVTVGLIFGIALLCNSRYGNIKSTFTPLLFYVLGAIFWGLLNAFVHEGGHVIACKKNGFYILGVNVWFFKWTRINKRMRFDFTLIGEEAGYTESVPKSVENLPARYKKTALGGVYASLCMTVIGIGLVFLVGKTDYRLFCALSMLLPISAYYFLGSLLPMVNGGAKNDGAVVFGIKKGEPSMQVACALLAVHSELFNGKTPSEIDKKYYFDVPQLPEDDLYFALMLSARYAYYIDGENYEEAKKISDRLYGLAETLPKTCQTQIKRDVLYNCCTFDFNEELADELMYELEKFLNSKNDATNLRVKLAYYIYVKKSGEYAKEIFDLGVRRASKCPLTGEGLYEKKLFDRMSEDVAAAALKKDPPETEEREEE